jgi:signal transduction histidine kinase
MPVKRPLEVSQRRSAGFPILSHRILNLANRGVLRPQFQQEVSRMILGFSGCDAVELWLKDRGKYSRGEVKRRSRPSPPVEIDLSPDHETDGLTSLCRDIILGRIRLAPPVFTGNGCLWVEDTQNPHPSLHRRAKGASLPVDLIPAPYRSLGILPLRVDQDNMGILLLKSRRTNYFKKDAVELFEYLAQNLGAALAHRHAQVNLRERVKELTCLYEIARLAARPGGSLEQTLQRIAELLPAAWLYPEITCARILLDDRSYATPAFKEGKHRQVAAIVVGGRKRGVVEVAYIEDRPRLDEGPFLKEERDLIDTVARELAIIIKRREAEDEHYDLQDQLRHADRLATIGQLAAGLAHELNEPLGNILGFAQLARRCPGLPDQAEQDLEKILKASLNAREVIRKMLAFARPQPPHKKKVSLNQIIEEGLYFFESRCAKEGIQILLTLTPELPEIYADPVQLNQVLVNLVINALQAMPKGGRLRIQTLAAQDHLSLIVEDSGPGMTEEVLKQIFTPFFTTKEIGQGTGLGLPVVHGIITSHGGTIQVKSQVGRGTRFEIDLPLQGPTGDEGDEPSWSLQPRENR